MLPLALIEAGTSPTLGIDPCVWRQLGGTCPGCSLGTSGHAQPRSFSGLFLPSCTPLSRCNESLSGKAAFPAYYCTSSEQPSTSRADPVRARAPSRADPISCSQHPLAAQSAVEHSTAARNREAQIRSDAGPSSLILFFFATGRKV